MFSATCYIQDLPSLTTKKPKTNPKPNKQKKKEQKFSVTAKIAPFVITC